jgi:fumarate hydratase class II
MAQTEERRELWGNETSKAVANFPVSGQPIPAAVARWLGRIKAAAARVNAELGLLDEGKAQRIAEAGERIAAGELDDQFPIDVFQTGSGTSSNMNANEVMAALAGDDVHANDDVNMGQSSNDVFPSAVHLAALDELTNDLLPALDRLASSLQAKAAEFDDVVKSGRTHLMDAVPVTLGQEFGGYAAQVRQGSERVKGTLGRVGQIPLGGTAVGTGLNTHPEFAERVRRRLSEETGADDLRARRSVRGSGGAGRARRGIGRAEDGGRLADEDRERPAPDGLRPSRRAHGDLLAGAAERAARSCRAR